MIGPKKSAETMAHGNDLAALSAMQMKCMRGEVSELEYNAHREIKKARLIAAGVQPGFIAAKLLNGIPVL